MNATLYNILNGIATSAKTAGDGNTISVCNQMVEQAARAFGATYDASSPVTSPIVILNNPYPAGSIPPSIDSITQLGNAHAVGG